jgi:predicted CxxxxCH...CXXCH cytochrome family protein
MRLDAPPRLLLLTGLLALAACGDSPTPTPTSANQGCAGCHGDSSRAGVALDQAAPPRDARGGTEATLVTVGAHQAHLRGHVACATCHAVPPEGDRTHINGPFATVVFSGNLVGAQGAVVAPWNRDQPTCANYCHGGFTNGNHATPAWTQATAMTCNSCHGAGTGAVATLPGGTHQQGKPDCSNCHAGYTTTSVNPVTHVNGKFDPLPLTCTACHGDATRAGTPLVQAAPPVDSHGRSGTNEVTVGAHQAHVLNGVDCATCHEVPPTGDITHTTHLTAVVQFSGPVVGANNTLVAPWNRNQATCANYCHGASLPGGAMPTPSWVYQGSIACGDCHADQQSTRTQSGLHFLHLYRVTPTFGCVGCHGNGYAAASVTPPATATHVNGRVELLSNVGWRAPACAAEGPRSCNATCHSAVPGCKVWP